MEKHEFSLLSKICHSNLRNAIAHQNFTIDSKGTVHILGGKKKKFSIRELAEIHSDIITAMTIFIFSFGDRNKEEPDSNRRK